VIRIEFSQREVEPEGLPLVGGGSLLLAHLLMAAGFRRRTDAMIARLEHQKVAELSTPPVPAIVQSFAGRAVRETPVPDLVWLRQSGEMRADLCDPWRPFTAEQVSLTSPIRPAVS